MNRSLVRTGSLTAGIAFALSLGTAALARQQPQPLWFMGSRLIFSHSIPGDGDLAVAADDTGLLRFLDKLGARLAYQPGERYIVITTADRRTVTFTLDDSHYTSGGLPDNAPFAPYTRGDTVYLPFYTLARALDVDPIATFGETVLQPQISALETHADHGRTIVTLRGALPLRPQIVAGGGSVTTVRFPGLASTLQAHRATSTPGLARIDVAVSGTARKPVTTMTFVSASGGRGMSITPPDATSAILAFAPAGVALKAPVEAPATVPDPDEITSAMVDRTAASPVRVTVAPPRADMPTIPAPAPPPIATVPLSADPSSVAVTGVRESATATAYVVKLGVTGSPAYYWHKLNDGRFYLDIPGAKMVIPRTEHQVRDPRVNALRLRSNGTDDSPNVRLALSLNETPRVSISSDAQTVTITVGGPEVAMGPRSGAGRVGQTAVVENPVPGPASGPPVGGRGGNLIVIDPGHGGSDTGAMHNGLTEKTLTLDIADRLREVLVARGWAVKMTRESDVDVYAPNDTAKEELQARCDVANRTGARYFVSIHINSFTSSDLNGTTTYYYKPADAGFAAAVEQKLVAALGTANDGARRENFYVVRHTTMPSILVETAFLSNPGDAQRLRSPRFRQQVAQAIGDGIAAYSGGPGAVTRIQSVMNDEPPSDDLSQ